MKVKRVLCEFYTKDGTGRRLRGWVLYCNGVPRHSIGEAPQGHPARDEMLERLGLQLADVRLLHPARLPWRAFADLMALSYS